MSDLPQEIRAILREELHNILAEIKGVETQRVRISSSADLNAFALDLVTRMQTSSFASKLRKGEFQFVLEDVSQPTPHNYPPAVPITAAPMSAAPMVVAPPKAPEAPVLSKNLITEADLKAFSPGVVRLPIDARITPLAQDESRRRGIRFERMKP